MWAGAVLVAFGVFYWRRTQGELESQKAVLFAQQRGVVAELGPKIEPFQRRIEDWVVDAASRPFDGDAVSAAARSSDFASQPGVYLRLRSVDATDAKKLRRAANDSLRDGFTSCLFHAKNPDPLAGPSCQATRQCPSGTFCNETDHCSPAAQPYNMRAVYRGTRVLSDEWTLGLRTAGDDMKMRLLQREFETAVRDDVPLAVDLLTRAQFFLLVLDEAPPDQKAPLPLEDLQAVPHPARVFLWSLKGGQEPLLRLRRQVNGKFVAAGEMAPTDPSVLAAEQRQVNSCQLALEVRAELESSGG